MKYERRVSLDPASEDQILLSLLGSGNSVLELGCHTGFFSVQAVLRGNSVVGLDRDAEAVRVARGRGIDAAVADLDASGALPGDQRFDVVLMANVLEHLRNPGQTLRDARVAVRHDGRLLVSVPNVAHVKVRLALLRGRFDYTDAGILDDTHLRFFTRRTLRRLLETNGWRVVLERWSPGLLGSTAGARVVRRLAPYAPDLFAIHLIAEARLRGGF